MAAHPKLVNKQFNSPIGLYSQQNIQEVLDREAQILANGAVGINFQNPEVGKPANLKNSAVLRMLEEEERQRNGIGPGVKRVAWPPPSESGSDIPFIEQNAVNAVPSQGGPQYSPQSPGLQQNNYQAPAQQRSVSSNLPTNRPLKPLDVSIGSSSPGLSSPLLNQSPQGFRPSTPAKGWAPVQSPVATPSPPSWQVQQQHSPAPQYQHQISTSSTSSWQQPQQRQSSISSNSSTTTRFQTAHQSVSQQTFLGQSYFPSSQSQQQITTQQQYQPVQQQYKQTQQQYQSSQQQYQQPQQSPQQQYQSAQQQYQSAQQQYQSAQQQLQASQQQYQPAQQQFQPAQQLYQPAQQQYQPAQQQFQPAQQQNQSLQQQNQYQTAQQQSQASQQQYQPSQQQQQYQAVAQQNQAFQSSQSAPKPVAAPSQVAPRAAPASKPAQPPPPSTITLRPNAPVSQAPPPVVTSQPATATLRGGKHLRGDLKWPPETVKLQFAEEDRLRLELAKGPACRPKKPNKDYSEFFAQHALNSTYPGYKIPPGTQFYRPV